MNETSSARTRVLTMRHQLRPSEQRVADLILSAPERIVESTADTLAGSLGIARTTVIRAAQSLGYRGYAHLRIAVTRGLATKAPAPSQEGAGVLARVRHEVRRVASRLPETLELITEADVQQALHAITRTRRIVLAANGLSAPLAHDLLMRLNAMGVHAQYSSDAMTQQVLAGSLQADDVLIALSGSGVNELTLRSVRAAVSSAATVIAVTSFQGTPLTELADVTLAVAQTTESFRDEIEKTSRIAHAVFLDSFLKYLEYELGDRGKQARDKSLSVVAGNLTDSDA